MPGATQTELQLRDLPAGQPFVEARPDLLAAEARQLGEQRRRVDLKHELAVAEAHDLAVRALRRGQHGVERLRERVARTLPTDLLDDAREEVAGLARFAHGDWLLGPLASIGLRRGQLPLIGITT